MTDVFVLWCQNSDPARVLVGALTLLKVTQSSSYLIISGLSSHGTGLATKVSWKCLHQGGFVAEAGAAKKEEENVSAEKKTVSADPPKPMLLIIVVILNMLIMGSVVMIVWTAQKAEKAKPKIQDVVQGAHEEAEKKAEAAEHEDYVGKLVPLETFLVNLAGTRGNKVVKINLEMEVENDKVEEEIEKRKPQIRDIIIVLLSSKTYDQLTTKQGKELLRDEIRDMVSSFLVKGKIKKVYFTDFIVN